MFIPQVLEAGELCLDCPFRVPVWTLCSLPPFSSELWLLWVRVLPSYCDSNTLLCGDVLKVNSAQILLIRPHHLFPAEALSDTGCLGVFKSLASHALGREHTL